MLGKRPQVAGGAPHEQAVFVRDLDERHRRVVGIAHLADLADAGQQVAGVPLLRLDQCRREDADDLVVPGVGFGHAEGAAGLAADVQVKIRPDAVPGKLVEKHIETVEGLRVQRRRVLRVEDAARPPGGVHVMEPDAVDACGGHACGDPFGVLRIGETRAETQVHAPDLDPLVADREVARLDGDPLGVGRHGIVRQGDGRLRVRHHGDDEGRHIGGHRAGTCRNKRQQGTQDSHRTRSSSVPQHNGTPAPEPQPNFHLLPGPDTTTPLRHFARHRRQ